MNNSPTRRFKQMGRLRQSYYAALIQISVNLPVIRACLPLEAVETHHFDAFEPAALSQFVVTLNWRALNTWAGGVHTYKQHRTPAV